MIKDKISMDDAENMFRDMLDCDGPVMVAGMPYNTSSVLQEMDPVAYRCAFNDYLDSISDEFEIEGY